MPADFEKQSYWQKRFETETTFEWLVDSATFVALLDPLLTKLDRSTARILHVGAGTSDLHNHLRARGFTDITNIDYEPRAAERGRDLELRRFGDVRMRYLTIDVTQMSFPGDQPRFDLVVDKSTADAVSCGGEEQVVRMADGVRKHLTEKACWVSLSYSGSRFEIDKLPLDVEVFGKIPTPKQRPFDPAVYHWCYLLRSKS